MNFGSILTDTLFEWDRVQPPSKGEIIRREIIQSVSPTAVAQSEIILRWIENRSYKEICEGDRIQSEEPFEYLTSAAAIYYVGGYIYLMFDGIIRDGFFIAEFSDIVLSSYLASNRIINDMICATIIQKKVLCQVCKIMSIPEFGNELKISDGQKSSLAALASKVTF
jgi:hypothetical protein